MDSALVRWTASRVRSNGSPASAALSRASTGRGSTLVCVRRSCGSVIFVDESVEYWSLVDGRAQVDHLVCDVVGCSLPAALVRAVVV